MLFNLCMALRHVGRHGEATEVARHVVRTWGHREGSADLRLFLAVEAALARAVPEATQHLEQVVVRENTTYDQQLLALAKAALELQQSPLDERRKAFRAIRRKLAPQFSEWQTLNSMRDVRRTFRRTGELFNQEGAGMQAWLWFKWKLHWQWSLLPLTPLLLAIAVQPPVLIGLVLWRLDRKRKLRA